MEEATFAAFNKVLSWGGVRVFSNNKNHQTIWLFLQIFNFIISIMAMTFTTGFVSRNVSDLLVLLRGACIWATCVILTMSLGIFLAFNDEFRSYIEDMVFKDAILDMPLIYYLMKCECNGDKLIELRKLVVESHTKLLKYTRVLLLSYAWITIICPFLYLSDTVYAMMKREDENERLFPFDMWFPWDVQDFNVYIFTFIGNVYAGYLCVAAYPGLQSTVILLVGQIVRQLRIMTFILLHRRELSAEMQMLEGGDWEEYSISILIQCVQHYIKLKTFGNKLNKICSPLYLTIIFVAIVLVCMSSVKIAISDKFSFETMKYYLHGTSFVFVVLMFSLLAQILNDECSKLGDVIDEKFYLYGKKHNMDIRIFKMALSQGMPTYLFGSVNLSLITFTWFIKNGMSFFTIVMSFLEERE